MKAGKQDITPQALASWLKWVIHSAYSELSPDQSRLMKIHAHELRAISASLAFARNFLSEISEMRLVGMPSPPSPAFIFEI